MTGPDDRTQELPRTVPAPNPRVVVYVLASAGAILLTAGVGILAGVGWAFVAAGAMLLLGAVLLVDVPRDRHAARQARPERGQVSPPLRPPPPPRPVFPTAVPDPQQPAAGSTRGG